MPHESIIRWIALGLIGLGVLWVIVAAVGLRPRAMRARRAIRRSGGQTLLCGACGHPAVSLGSIETCPECGAAYARVGLDAAATSLRWSPPLFVLGLTLLGLWALGSIVLAPIAARWTNERSIGAPMVSSERTLLGFTPAGSAQGPQVLPSFALEIDAEFFRPMNPATSLVPPPLPTSSITVRVATGPGTSNAGSIWQNVWQSSPFGRIYGMGTLSPAHMYGRVVSSPSAPPPPHPIFASPWAAMFAASPPHELAIDPTNERWTLRDPAGDVLEEGTGVHAALSALLDHGGLAAMADADGLDAEQSVDVLADAIESLTSATRRSNRLYLNPSVLPPMGSPPATTKTTVSLQSLNDLGDAGGTHLYHPAAPWGLAAAIATSGSLLLIALVLIILSWRIRRRLSPGVQTAMAREP